MRYKMKVEELINSLPKLKGLPGINQEDSMIIPWTELDDRLEGIEPNQVKRVAKGMGLDCKFRGYGMLLIPFK
jgi:hypothetical protein